MTPLNPDQLKTPDWAGKLPEKQGGKARMLRPEFMIPLLAVAILAALGAHVFAATVAVIAITLAVLRRSNAVVRDRIDRGFAAFAETAGKVVAAVLLAVPFFVIMPIVRCWSRMEGADPLRLRAAEAPTHWLPAEGSRRRAKHARNLFCPELRIRGRLALLPLCVFGVGLLVFTEIGLRIYGFGNPILFIQDPDIGYHPLPSQTLRHPGRVVSINSHGMRSPETGAAKATGITRILMIGDSTLAGTKVSNGELYSHILEEMLNERAGKRRFEVLNMGVNAWGPLHQEAFISKFGTFDADIAIICGPVANVFRPRYGLERLPFSPAGNPPKTAIGHLAYELMWRVRERTLGLQPWALEGPAQDAQAGQGTAAYRRMAEMFQAAGAEVRLEMLPARNVTLGGAEDPFGERMFAPIRESMAGIGVEAYLAGAIFKDAADPERVYYDGVHFGEYGHGLYAGYLFGRLMENSPSIRRALDDERTTGGER
jgi:hypothetical protein